MSAHLNEQEQVEIIKAFWRKYGNWILAAVIVVAVGVAAWRFWQRHDQTEMDDASVYYQTALMGLKQHQTEVVAANTAKLQSHFADTAYASMASFALAKQLIDANNFTLANAQLKWVVKHAQVSAFKAVALLRLARIALAQGQEKTALNYMQKLIKGFAAEFYALQGDAYTNLHKVSQAREAYDKSLSHLKTTDPLYPVVEMSRNALPVAHAAHTKETK